MALVKLPNGDMWDPDRLNDPQPKANQSSPAEEPDPVAYNPERLDAATVSGWTTCPWCGMTPKGPMADHVRKLHQVEISQDIVEARAIRGLNG